MSRLHKCLNLIGALMGMAVLVACYVAIEVAATDPERATWVLIAGVIAWTAGLICVSHNWSRE